MKKKKNFKLISHKIDRVILFMPNKLKQIFLNCCLKEI